MKMQNEAGRTGAAIMAFWALAMTFFVAHAGTTCTFNNGSWSPQAPVAGDDVVIQGGNLSWSSSLPSNVASWTQQAGYTNTVTFQTVYGTTGFTNFTVNGNVTLNGGSWAHTGNTLSEANRLCVTVNGNLLITNATINADILGYGNGQGPGGGSTQAGGAYGGAAASGLAAGLFNLATYGSIYAPTNLGSGGSGSAGGGAILLTVAGTTTVASAGMITAKGANYLGGSGGAGGSVYLTTGWLTGNGTLQANGGYGANGGWGGGSGGRVAIILTGTGADFSTWGGTNTAYGAPAPGIPGAAGTVYRKTQAGVDTLIIDNNGVATYDSESTLLSGGVNLNSFSNVVINHKGILGVKGDTTLDFTTFNPMTYGPSQSYLAIESDTNVTYPANWMIDGLTVFANNVTTGRLVNLTIGTNGMLSHAQNYDAETFKLNLKLSGNLTILSNGMINTDARGYCVTNGAVGTGPGGGSALFGGAYGGEAPGGATLTVNPRTYGSVFSPTNLGSAGGGGAGGGAILLTVAGTTTVASAGSISSGGGSSAGNGGGAGGSIYLNTGWLAGNGTLQANGGTGPGGNNSGGGGGGRVAIILTGAGADFSIWTGTNTALGGPTWGAAAAGTVYRQAKSDPAGAGMVIVSNGLAATPLTGVPGSQNPGETLAASTWLVTGYGELGVTTNVQLGFLTITGASARVDLKGRVLSVLPDLNINGKLYGAGSYRTNNLTGVNVLDSVGGGILEVRPAVDNAGGATNVTQTSASLNGNLYVADASSTALFALWGKNDAGTNVAQWAHTNTWLASQTAGSFSVAVAPPDLLANTVQYYRFYTTNNIRQNIASNSSIFMTSDVTVQKVADASEDGLVPGAFTFSRDPAATNGTITVSYTIGGTAKPGTNYVNNLGTSITFAQGASQTNLTITPLQDDVSQSNETIVLTLTSGPYHIGSSSVATGLVLNLGLPSAPTNTWIGTGNASQATNWSLGHAPTNTEYILLSGFSKKSIVWDVTNAVVSWRQTAQYTGTVTFATVYGTTGFTNFTVSGDVTLSGGAWTHQVNTTAEAKLLRVSVGGNLLITNAVITSDVLGYSSGTGPGGASGINGGAYGGEAPGGQNFVPNPKTYGSVIAPTNLGSGGGGSGGGGAIVLTVAGTTTLASGGLISANGESNAGNGGGSGGSVYLTTGWLTGSGTIRANGGTGPGGNNSGGGSGGRVAIILTGSSADFTLWSGTNAAYGGSAWGVAAAGTVYRKTSAGVDTLFVDNNNMAGQISTLMPSAVNLNSFSNVVIQNKGILGVRGDTTLDFSKGNLTTYGPTNSYMAMDGDTNVTYPATWIIDGYTLYVNSITPNKPVNVTVGTNGVVAHYPNYSAETYKLNLAISGNLTVLSNGAINVDGLGYANKTGPGTPGQVTYGGAYGGWTVGDGRARVTGSYVNPFTYGSILAPTNLGSGGANDGAPYGTGGGAILLTVAGTTTVTNGGLITANGGTGAHGGGSGGSIYLTTGWLTGGGMIRANGGTAGMGGGSGGRIALILTGAGADFTSWNGTNTARGGATATPVAAGTVYRQVKANAAGAGTVIVDNGTSAINTTLTTLPAFTNSMENISNTVWVTYNNARLGLVTNAVTASLTLNANDSLELGGYTLTVKALTVTNKVYKSGIYTAANISLLTDGMGGGKVIVNAPVKGTGVFFR